MSCRRPDASELESRESDIVTLEAELRASKVEIETLRGVVGALRREGLTSGVHAKIDAPTPRRRLRGLWLVAGLSALVGFALALVAVALSRG